MPAYVFEEAVLCRQHAVSGARLVVDFEVFFVADVFVDGVLGFSLCIKTVLSNLWTGLYRP